MYEHNDKLCQLTQSYVLLPPNRLPHFGFESTQQIIGIHQHMRGIIVQRKCATMTAKAMSPQVKIARAEQHGMMIDVQQSNLLVALAQHKEYCVAEVKEFQDVVGVIDFRLQCFVWVIGRQRYYAAIVEAGDEEIAKTLLKRRHQSSCNCYFIQKPTSTLRYAHKTICRQL